MLINSVVLAIGRRDNFGPLGIWFGPFANRVCDIECRERRGTSVMYWIDFSHVWALTDEIYHTKSQFICRFWNYSKRQDSFPSQFHSVGQPISSDWETKTCVQVVPFSRNMSLRLLNLLIHHTKLEGYMCDYAMVISSTMGRTGKCTHYNRSRQNYTIVS